MEHKQTIWIKIKVCELVDFGWRSLKKRIKFQKSASFSHPNKSSAIPIKKLNKEKRTAENPFPTKKTDTINLNEIKFYNFP